MLSRLSRAGLRALTRARPGQNSVTSRSHEVEAISTYTIPVLKVLVLHHTLRSMTDLPIPI
nr:unnamed protein product [Digitaria exilis]